MPDPLFLLWERSDASSPFYSAEEFTPKGSAESLLLRLGLIRETDNSDTVTCDACDGGHEETVEFVQTTPSAALRAYIYCPANGRVSVPLERLKRWTIDFNALAKSVAKNLSLTGEPEELSAARIWFLGKGTFAGRTLEVFLARGMTWGDAKDILDRTPRILSASFHIVLVSGIVPPLSTWKNEPLRVIPLSAIAAIENGKLALDRGYLTGQLQTTKQKARQVQKSFPTPAGATWQDVSIEVMEHSLSIRIHGLKKTYTFQEAGFEDGRRKSFPDRYWTLLQILGHRVGVLKHQDDKLDHKARTNLKQYIHELRRHLQALIPNIDADPIVHNSDGRAYETVFKISSSENPQLSVPQGIVWSGVSIVLVAREAIRVSYCSNEAFRGHAYSEDQLPENESAERERTDTQTVYLDSIKLSTKGKLNKVGQALVAVLEGNGRIQRDMEDGEMLTLGKILSDLLRIDDAPFEFDTGSGTWTAKFDASSEYP